MGGLDATSGKRKAESANDAKRKKKQRYARSASTDVRRELPHGSRGFVVSCDPRHENQCYREAHSLLSEEIEVCAHAPPSDCRAKALGTAEFSPGAANRSTDSATPDPSSRGECEQAMHLVTRPPANISGALAAEVAALRESKSQDELSRIELNVQGSIFIRVHREDIPVDTIVERVLRNAKKNQTPGSRHCVRFVPVHSTCYAKAEDAASAAFKVASKHFPVGKSSYAIHFKSRMNSDAHREDFIKAIAAAIETIEPGRFKVNLEKPDVVLCVEVIKTQCFLGCFRYFYELAKLNIREVSKPARDGKHQNGKEAAKGGSTIPSAAPGTVANSVSVERQSAGDDGKVVANVESASAMVRKEAVLTSQSNGKDINREKMRPEGQFTKQ